MKISDASLAGVHVDELRRSAIPEDLARKAGVVSVADRAELRDLTGDDFGERVPALVFPYFKPSAPTVPAGHRVKPSFPLPGRGGKGRKYTQRSGWTPGLYFGPRLLVDEAARRDLTTPLLVVEGEKKTLAIEAAGFAVVGLGGIASYGRGRRSKELGEAPALHEDFGAFALAGRRVIIVPDADVRTKRGVHAAVCSFAALLARAGADARVLELPALEAGEKTGADDFIAAKGSAAFAALVAAAVPVEGIRLVDPDDKRPRLALTADEDAVIASVIERLADDPTLFVQGGRLVHVVEDRERASDNPNAARVVPAAEAYLRSLVTKHVVLVDGEGRPEHPPHWLAPGILHRGSWPRIRPLAGIVEAPVIRRDGSVLAVAGYDPASALLLAPSGPIPEIPTAPDVDDARTAAAELCDVLRDFPFLNDAHRSIAVSVILSVVARPFIDGPVPLHFIEANVRGAGKTLLAQIAAIIATGSEVPARAIAKDGSDEEMRKALFAVALGGAPLALFDNVRGLLESAALEGAITSGQIASRTLGKSEDRTAKLSAVILATGNNASLGGDLGRRTLLCRLESPHEQPEHREDLTRGEGELKAHVKACRGRLLAAAITMVLASRRAPAPALRAWGSFSAYSDVVRRALVVAGLPDPIEAMPDTRDRADHDADLTRELYFGWHEAFGDRELPIGDVIREVWRVDDFGRVRPPGPKVQRLRTALEEVARVPAGAVPGAVSLGRRLGSYVGRPMAVEGQVRALGSRRDEGHNVNVWSVRSGGPGGPGGCSVPPRTRDHVSTHDRSVGDGVCRTSGTSGTSGDLRDEWGAA